MTDPCPAPCGRPQDPALTPAPETPEPGRKVPVESPLIQAGGVPASGRAHRAARGTRAISAGRCCRPGKIAAAAAGTAAALLAVGCSGHTSVPAPGSLSPLRAITLAADQARQVSSFSSTVSFRMSGAASGVMAGTMRMRIRPNLLAVAEFSTIDVAGQSLHGAQEIMTNKAIFVKITGLQQRLGKPWLEAELPKGAGPGFLTQWQGSNPLLQTQMLASAKTVRAVGTQVIDGVPTTHYAGTYSVAAGLAKLPPSLRSPEQKALRRLGVTSASFNVWLDARHQVRRLAESQQGGGEQVAMTMQVSGINQPVSASFPPASQVATVPASALVGG